NHPQGETIQSATSRPVPRADRVHRLGDGDRLGDRHRGGGLRRAGRARHRLVVGRAQPADFLGEPDGRHAPVLHDHVHPGRRELSFLVHGVHRHSARARRVGGVARAPQVHADRGPRRHLHPAWHRARRHLDDRADHLDRHPDGREGGLRPGVVRHLHRAAGGDRRADAAADAAARLAQDTSKDILVLAGPGNYGGDSKICAERLRERFFRVTVAQVADPATLPGDKRWALIIDGLFGIGLTRPITGEFARLVDYANQQSCPILALDVPSGIDADTGRVLGHAVRATHTITFIALKPGLLTLDGPDHCGEIRVDALGIELPRAKAWVADRDLFPSVFRARPRNFHKGNAGSLGIVGGARGMTGAALIAGRAALRLGAGRVYVGLLNELPVDPGAPELMLRQVDDVLGQDLDAVVAGPGLGRTEHAATLVGAVLASDWPCVLDADALNLMADDEDLRDACERRRANTLITPHPAEAGRLLNLSVGEIQADRLAAAQALSRRYNAHVDLKGNGSILIARDGHLFINTTGNPGMASAGMGDALSGILGALLAQRLSGESTLVLGVHLHGAAADELVASGVGPAGITATESIDAARRLWNRWLTPTN